ncbi:hypothetical protein CIHG_08154 [Coccidioides immitis H538.4]|uniref:Uncharacterized protein n=3 Tax=Coccidioides immitis TaxID=5501 RepID=A0A0J8RC05_COCIT|nr:hypothetical protein CIRG_04226 [Coccidioides immitis RMSCC 2394]KMU81960.1 hypothetical protein CISG_09421 [Coccidioides immitis RMSCC 3703]KMU90345.1 hypothetical protein CIHG_08154 [Coccidioides immitis H538.4]
MTSTPATVGHDWDPNELSQHKLKRVFPESEGRVTALSQHWLRNDDVHNKNWLSNFRPYLTGITFSSRIAVIGPSAAGQPIIVSPAQVHVVLGSNWPGTAVNGPFFWGISKELRRQIIA